METVVCTLTAENVTAETSPTCLCGTFSNARRLLEEVGDRGLTDLQVVASVRLRRQRRVYMKRTSHREDVSSWSNDLKQPNNLEFKIPRSKKCFIYFTNEFT